jgi:hypothetical protein
MERSWPESEVESLVHLVEQVVPLSSICTNLKREPDDVLKKIRTLAIKYDGWLPPQVAGGNRQQPGASF